MLVITLVKRFNIISVIILEWTQLLMIISTSVSVFQIDLSSFTVPMWMIYIAHILLNFFNSPLIQAMINLLQINLGTDYNNLLVFLFQITLASFMLRYRCAYSCYSRSSFLTCSVAQFTRTNVSWSGNAKPGICFPTHFHVTYRKVLMTIS